MSMNFGKGNRSIAFNPTSAFPLDARTYFESLTEAQAAAKTAEEVGSTNTKYHYGMKLLVYENGFYTWYEISRSNTLVAESSVENGMKIPVIFTELTWDSTSEELLSVVRSNGITKNDVCIIVNSERAIMIMLKMDDVDEAQSIQIPLWFDFGNPAGYLGLVALSLDVTLRELSQQYSATLKTTDKSVRGAINELYEKINDSSKVGKTVDLITEISTSSDEDATLEVSSDGLAYTAEFIGDINESRETLATPTVHLPIVAGDNVSIEATKNDSSSLVFKISASSGSSLEMPIIRFTGVRSFNGTQFLTSDNTFYFCVDIIGGGAIKNGDLLELCVMRTCKRSVNDIGAGKKRQRLRKLFSQSILVGTIQPTELVLSVEGTDKNQGQLFKNDRASAVNYGCRSNVYLRIKRPFFDEDGNENNAIFSNIIMLDKSYYLGTGKLTFK